MLQSKLSLFVVLLFLLFCFNDRAESQDRLFAGPGLPLLDPTDPLAKKKRNNPITFKKQDEQWPPIFSAAFPLEILNQDIAIRGNLFLLSGVADRTKKPPERQNLFFWHKINQPDEPPQRAYTIESRAPLHTPQISPDRNAVLMRIGFAPDGLYNPIGLLVWNFKKQQFHYVNASGQEPFIYYPAIKWSPGGRYLSYVRDGNALGSYESGLENYRLCVCDLQTFEDREILSHAGLSWSWTTHATVLCSPILPSQAIGVASRQARPSVYEAAVGGKTPSKLFDGGYFAHESPDGQWIAFCDWPGSLLEKSPTEPNTKAQRGLFLWNRAAQQRTFVGPLKLEAGITPLIQWAPDSSGVYVLETQFEKAQTGGVLYKIKLENAGKDKVAFDKLAELKIPRASGVASGPSGLFQWRGVSNDERFVFVDTIQVINGPTGYVHTSRTLLAIETATGQQTSVARLKNIANANPNWDWHDDSGINPVLEAAQKLEEALPPIVAVPAPPKR